MGIVWGVLIGFVIGLCARALRPGKDPMGCIATIVIGILGSVVGGALGRFFGLYADGEPASFIVSVIGAVLVLFIYSRMTRAK